MANKKNKKMTNSSLSRRRINKHKRALQLQVKSRDQRSPADNQNNIESMEAPGGSNTDTLLTNLIPVAVESSNFANKESMDAPGGSNMDTLLTNLIPVAVESSNFANKESLEAPGGSNTDTLLTNLIPVAVESSNFANKESMEAPGGSNTDTLLTNLIPVAVESSNFANKESMDAPGGSNTDTLLTNLIPVAVESSNFANKESLEAPGGSNTDTLLTNLIPVAVESSNFLNKETIVNDEPLCEMQIDKDINSNVSTQNNNDVNMEQIDDYYLTLEIEKEDDYQPFSGRRLIDVNYLMSQLQEKSYHIDLFDCKAGYFQLVGEKRIGLKSKFKFKCNICLNVIEIDSEKPASDNADSVDANIAAVTGIVATGIGFAQFEEMFSALDVPVFSRSYFTRLQDFVYENWEKSASESMEAAAKREKEAAIAEGRIKDGIPLIDVFVDGAWGSRSYGNNYRAMSGVAAIIGRKFGEVLYMGVKNKYCMICARAQKKGLDPKEHKCYKNYDGSSSGMEADIISEGFKASIEMYGIMYARMIGDGDSSTYAKVLNAKPYDNHTVEKIECRNHILRNFCKNLRAVANDTKYSRAHRKTLTNEKVMSMRKVIVKSIKYHKSSENSKNISITLLHKDITNSVAHAYGDHRLCSDFNCTKDKNLLSSTIKDVQNSTFLFRLNAIVATTAAKARSLIEDVDTNAVERFNSVIAKFVGGKRINFSLRRGYQGRCSAALISYNNESAISTVQKSILGRSPKGRVKEIENRRSVKRKLNRDHPTKKFRKFIEKKTLQHDYGPTSSAPDLNPEQMQKAEEDFLSNLDILTSDRHNIERTTVLQRDCSEWMEIRKNLVTASNFGSICKRQMSRNSAPLVKNILYKQNIAHISSVAHGVQNEKQALQQIEQQENIVIEPCGLFIDKKYQFIGATPDGLVGEDTIVEVKCPITAFKKGIDTAIKENKIQIYKFNKKTNTKILNKKSNWYYQVQGQLHVTERKKCIFGIWSGENQPLIIEYIARDDEFWKTQMEKKIVDFYLKCLLPEIVDPRQIRGLPIRDITLEENKENIPSFNDVPAKETRDCEPPSHDKENIHSFNDVPAEEIRDCEHPSHDVHGLENTLQKTNENLLYHHDYDEPLNLELGPGKPRQLDFSEF